MSTRKPRRIRWQPNTDTLATACRRASKLSAAEISEVMEPLQHAFAALRRGVATEWQWSIIASAVNCAKAIETQGVVRGLHEHLCAAELSLQAIYRRAMAGTTWQPSTLYYIELDAIGTAVELHAFQLQNLARGEVIRALDYAQAEVRSTGGRVIDTAAPKGATA